jgi:hypothetical protein
MSKQMWILGLILVFFSLSLSGCYYFSARNQIKSAEKLVSDLKGAGGETLAPYEYCSAHAYLEMSKMEFDENAFKWARELATRSKSAAQAGLSEVKKK